MPSSKRDRPREGRTSDTTSFRKLVDKRISPDEYVKRLDERVRERVRNEETLRGRGTGAEPQPT